MFLIGGRNGIASQSSAAHVEWGGDLHRGELGGLVGRNFIPGDANIIESEKKKEGGGGGKGTKKTRKKKSNIMASS